MVNIVVKAGNVQVKVEMHDTPTAEKIIDAIPFESEAMRWGEEVYFSTPVSAKTDETAKEVMEIGDVGYWPAGKALAIFFGPTPASTGDEPRAASVVNVVGKVLGDACVLTDVNSGDPVTVSI